VTYSGRLESSRLARNADSSDIFDELRKQNTSGAPRALHEKAFDETRRAAKTYAKRLREAWRAQNLRRSSCK